MQSRRVYTAERSGRGMDGDLPKNVFSEKASPYSPFLAMGESHARVKSDAGLRRRLMQRRESHFLLVPRAAAASTLLPRQLVRASTETSIATETDPPSLSSPLLRRRIPTGRERNCLWGGGGLFFCTVPIARKRRRRPKKRPWGVSLFPLPPEKGH